MFSTPRFYINFNNFKIASFHFFGILGVIAACITEIIFTDHLHIPFWVAGLISFICVSQLFLHAWIQKIITGKENMVYLRHEIVILLSCSIILWSIGQPVKPVLDATLLSIGAGLFFGRIGCYNAGCCHGRPCKTGVKYSQQHLSAGFPLHLKGVRIFPITLIESFFVGIIVLSGVWFILNNYPPGTSLIWYTVLYGLVRFVLEFFRGDTERAYWQGFSEAQWTIVALFVFSGILSWYKLLPFYGAHFMAIVFLATIMLIIFLARNGQSFSAYKITSPQHVKEIATALAGIEPAKYFHPIQEWKTLIPIAVTSLGLKISSGIIREEKLTLFHYTLSVSETNAENRKATILNNKIANKVAGLIQKLKHSEISFQIREVKTGIYHVIFYKYNE